MKLSLQYSRMFPFLSINPETLCHVGRSAPKPGEGGIPRIPWDSLDETSFFHRGKDLPNVANREKRCKVTCSWEQYLRKKMGYRKKNCLVWEKHVVITKMVNTELFRRGLRVENGSLNVTGRWVGGSSSGWSSAERSTLYQSKH